jgi:hypothetical protein
MKARVSLIAVGVLAAIGLFLAGPFLGADGPQTAQVIPDGFTGEYVVVERKDGSMTILQLPQLRTLGPKTYLVGKTISIKEVTDDALFEPTKQWVCLEDVRRMGETTSGSDLENIRAIAVQRRLEGAEEKRRIEAKQR